MDPKQKETILQRLYGDRKFALAKTCPEQFQLIMESFLEKVVPNSKPNSDAMLLEPLFKEIRENLENWSQLHNRKSYRKARQYVKTANRLAQANSQDDLETIEQLYSKAINLLPPSSPPLCEDHSSNQFGRCRCCDRRSLQIEKLKSYAFYKRALLRFDREQYPKVLQDIDVLMRHHFDLSEEAMEINEQNNDDNNPANDEEVYDNNNYNNNVDYMGEPRTPSFNGRPFTMVELVVLALKCFDKLDMIKQNHLNEVLKFLEDNQQCQNDDDEEKDDEDLKDQRNEIIETIVNLVRYNSNNCNFSGANTSLKFCANRQTTDKITVSNDSRKVVVTAETETETEEVDDDNQQTGDTTLESEEESSRQQQNVEEQTDDNPDDADYFRYLLDSRCKLRYDSNKGRHWIADSTIPKGSVILVEKPYSMTVAKDYLTSNCNYCTLKLSETGGYTCTRCNEAVYCCVECMEQAYSQYHRHECGYLGLLLNISMTSSILYRMVTCVGVKRALVYDRKFKSTSYTIEDYLAEAQLRTTPVSKMTELDHFSMYRMSTALIEHSEKYSPVMNAYHGMNALEISLILLVQHPKLMETFRQQQEQRLETSFSDADWSTARWWPITTPTDNILYDLFQLCVVQLRRIAVNIFGSYDHYSSRGKQVVTNCEFLIASLINHSCDPNVEWQLDNGHIIFKTKREIKANEELNITYGQTRANRLEQRQEHLFNTYFFRCRCLVCKEDVIRTTDNIITSCQACLTGPVVKAKTSAGCLDCGSSFPLDQIELIHQKIIKSDQLLNLYLKMLNCFYQNLDNKKKKLILKICQQELEQQEQQQQKSKQKSSNKSSKKKSQLKVCKKKYLTILKSGKESSSSLLAINQSNEQQQQQSSKQSLSTNSLNDNLNTDPYSDELTTEHKLLHSTLSSVEAIHKCFEKYCYDKSRKYESRMQNVAKLYLSLGQRKTACKLAVELFLKKLESDTGEEGSDDDEWQLSIAQLERQLISYNFWTEVCCQYCEYSIKHYGVIREVAINKLTLLMYVKFLKLCCCYLQHKDNQEKIRRVEQQQSSSNSSEKALATAKESTGSSSSAMSSPTSALLVEHVDQNDFVEKCAFSEIKLIYILSEQKKAKLISILKNSNVL